MRRKKSVQVNRNRIRRKITFWYTKYVDKNDSSKEDKHIWHILYWMDPFFLQLHELLMSVVCCPRMIDCLVYVRDYTMAISCNHIIFWRGSNEKKNDRMEILSLVQPTLILTDVYLHNCFFFVVHSLLLMCFLPHGFCFVLWWHFTCRKKESRT